MARVLHVADVHLDSPMLGLAAYEGAPVQQLRLATRRAFTNTVDVALAESVDLVLIAGDLYDGQPKDAATGLFLVSQLNRLVRAGIEVVMILGNHDAASKVTASVPLPKAVRVLSTRSPETVRYDALGLAVHGQSYARHAVSDDLAANYGDPLDGYANLGLLHTSLAGGWDGHGTYAPCALSTLTGKGYAYWALGHIHQHRILNEDPHVVFSGCLQGRGLHECGPKGAVLLDIAGAQVSSMQRTLTDVVRWARVSVEVEGAEDIDALYDRVHDALAQELIAAEDRPLACRVILSGHSSLHRRLAGAPAKVLDDLRAVALMAGDEQIWLQGVEIATALAPSADDLAARRDPLERLLGDARARIEDPDALVAASVAVSDVSRALPPGVLEDGQGPESAQWREARARGAFALIAGRLGRELVG